MANVAFGLNKFGNNLFGLGSGEDQYLFQGNSTFVSSPSVQFSSFQAVKTQSSTFTFSKVDTEAGYTVLSATTLMTARPDVRFQAGSSLTQTSSMTGSGSVAWETQTANPVSWVIQREHPNG